MREAFIPFQTADGQRRSVSIHQIPSLFSEGLEECEPPMAKPWHRLSERWAGLWDSLRLQMKFRLDHGLNSAVDASRLGPSSTSALQTHEPGKLLRSREAM